jgi:hypothetical protein
MVRPLANSVEIKERFSGVLSARSVANPINTFKRLRATFVRGRKAFRSISRNLPEALIFGSFHPRKRTIKIINRE